MKNQEKELQNENSDNTERKLTKEELTALCRRAKEHAQKFGRIYALAHGCCGHSR